MSLKRELSWSRCKSLEPPETEEEEEELAKANARFEEANEIDELAEFGCPDYTSITTCTCFISDGLPQSPSTLSSGEQNFMECDRESRGPGRAIVGVVAAIASAV